MIIIEVITLIASIGTCVFAFLVWKSDLLNFHNEKNESVTDETAPDELAKNSVIEGVGAILSDKLSRIKKTNTIDANNNEQELSEKNLEHTKQDSLLSSLGSFASANIGRGKNSNESSSVLNRDTESQEELDQLNQSIHNEEEIADNNKDILGISSSFMDEDSPIEEESIKDYYPDNGKDAIDSELTKDYHSVISKDENNSNETSKNYDNYLREFFVDDSITEKTKLLDRKIEDNSFSSKKIVFLVGSVLLLILAVVFGIIKNEIVFGVCLVSASLCVFGFAMKQVAYLRLVKVKEAADNAYNDLLSRVKALNDNDHLKEDEKSRIINRWISKYSDDIDEKLHSIRKAAFNIGVISGVLVFVIVGLIFTLPMIIERFSSYATNESYETTNESELLVTETTLEIEPTLTPTLIPTANPTLAPVQSNIVIADPVNVTGLVTNVTASSMDDSSGGNYYYPDYIMDGDITTCWAEGVDGSGIGESVTISIPAGTFITGLIIYTGYCKSSDVFYNNGAPSVINFRCGDYVCNLELDTADNNYAAQNYEIASAGIQLNFPTTIISDGELTLTIADVRDGASWNDTCISEIRLLGAAAGANGEPRPILTMDQAHEAFSSFWDEYYEEIRYQINDSYTSFTFDPDDSDGRTCVYQLRYYLGANAYDSVFFYMDLGTGAVRTQEYEEIPLDSAATPVNGVEEVLPGIWFVGAEGNVFNAWDYLSSNATTELQDSIPDSAPDGYYATSLWNMPDQSEYVETLNFDDNYNMQVTGRLRYGVSRDDLYDYENPEHIQGSFLFIFDSNTTFVYNVGVDENGEPLYEYVTQEQFTNDMYEFLYGSGLGLYIEVQNGKVVSVGMSS